MRASKCPVCGNGPVFVKASCSVKGYSGRLSRWHAYCSGTVRSPHEKLTAGYGKTRGEAARKWNDVAKGGG